MYLLSKNKPNKFNTCKTKKIFCFYNFNGTEFFNGISDDKLSNLCMELYGFSQ